MATLWDITNRRDKLKKQDGGFLLYQDGRRIELRKLSTSWTGRVKPNTSWTGRVKPNTSWTGRAKP